MNKLIPAYILLLFCMVLSMPLAAQNTGGISGVVRDASDNSPLAGAIVYVEATNMKTETNAEGKYTIKNIPEGTYNFYVTYVGFNVQKITYIHVELGKEKILNFTLQVGRVWTEDWQPMPPRKLFFNDCSGRIITK